MPMAWLVGTKNVSQRTQYRHPSDLRSPLHRKKLFKCPSYIIYDTKYPSEWGHGGTAVIVKNKIRHHENPKYATERMQST